MRKKTSFYSRTLPLLAAVSMLLPLSAAAQEAAQGTWCIARATADEFKVQKALDYACGPGGADCAPIEEHGRCYDELTTARSRAGWAFNSYFQKQGQAEHACDFDGTAIVIKADPSPSESCKFPGSPAQAQ